MGKLEINHLFTKCLCLCFLMLFLTPAAKAYEFSYTYNGQTLYYNITGGTARVTYQHTNASSSPNYANLTGSLTIPSTVTHNGSTYAVTHINASAFHDCSGLTFVTIPTSVTNIGNSAFRDCVSLTSITIPSTVTTIGTNPFIRCSSLVSISVNANNPNYDSRGNCNAIIETATNILISGCKNTVIPNNITTIGHAAFRGCSNLLSITIPNTVTTIDKFAFYNCDALTTINIPNSVSIIDNYAFDSCTSLQTITLGNSISTIGDLAFCHCSNLTTVVIPNSVTTINRSAFSYCGSLTSVTIGSSVTSIGNTAFKNCSGLTEIISKANEAPSLGNNVFQNVPSSIPVTIPCGSTASYSAGWSYFSNFIEDCAEEYMVFAQSDNPIMGTATVNGMASVTVYDGDEVVFLATSNPGYHFVRWNDYSTDSIRTVTVNSDLIFIAYFEANNSTEEINAGITVSNIRIFYHNGCIFIDGVDGNIVTLIDVNGRILATKQDGYTPLCFGVPASGAYLVKIGNHPARKVVVIR